MKKKEIMEMYMELRNVTDFQAEQIMEIETAKQTELIAKLEASARRDGYELCGKSMQPSINNLASQLRKADQEIKELRRQLPVDMDQLHEEAIEYDRWLHGLEDESGEWVCEECGCTGKDCC